MKKTIKVDKSFSSDKGESLVSRSLALPKRHFSLKRLLQPVIKAVSYIVLILSAAYGLRQMLVAVTELVAYALVFVIVVLIIWIIAE